MHRRLSRTSARLQRLLRHRLEPEVLGPAIPLAVTMSTPRFDPTGAAPDADGLTPVTLPVRWGPAWHTTWFRLSGRVPSDWAGRTVVADVDLGFRGRHDGFQVEGLVWRDGALRHALQPDRRTLIVADSADGDEVVDLWVEAASNPVMADDPHDLSYRPTLMGDPQTAPHTALYVMRRADLAVVNPDVEALTREVQVLLDLLGDLDSDHPWSPWLERRAEAVIGAVDLSDVVGTAGRARAELAPVFRRQGAPERHRIVAVGHAHLDTAWLWPVREARRKARRTFANAADLADRYPEFRFAHSQAQHWAWIEQDDPALFRRVRDHVKAGRIEPVGGMWVEADLNLSGGESLVRQFLHGQHAFHHWFGIWCDVGFLPDDFGYPASFPQLLRGAGCRGFFTQKLSWNETNRFPHHTFWWEGLDGSRVLTHFSPIETYNAVVMPSQLRFGERNFADHAVSNRSLMCFGHGDGGGGPTAEMVERVGLLADVEVLPRVEWGGVAQFFSDVATSADTAATWVGEIVLEKHRGTYTAQVATKQGDIACEKALRAAELWSTATGRSAEQRLRDCWQRLLVEQFHDILPGSSIAWVHRDAEQVHAEVLEAAQGIVEEALGGSRPCVANAAPVARDEVVVVQPGHGAGTDRQPVAGVQVCRDGTWAAHVCVDALASAPWEIAHRAVSPFEPVMVDRNHDGTCSMDNGLVRVEVDHRGRVTRLIDLRHRRNVLRSDGHGARLTLHLDQPAEYDAWDIDEPDARRAAHDLPDAQQVEIIEAGPLLARVRCTHRFGASTVVHELTLTAGARRVDHRLDVAWWQSEQRLAFVLPVDVGGATATAGVQFGHVTRPRHSNTSWQAAQFEQVAHRFVHVGETRFGVALVFRGPRGVDVNHPDRHLALSLLRSPRYPDPHADRGQRELMWSTLITHGDPWGDGRTHGLEVEAQRHAHPVHVVGRPVRPPVRHDLRGVLVEAFKAPHRVDTEGGEHDHDVIVRLWESEGARTSGTIVFDLDDRIVEGVTRCDLLERPWNDGALDGGPTVELAVAPFEIVTLRLRVRPRDPSQYRDR